MSFNFMLIILFMSSKPQNTQRIYNRHIVRLSMSLRAMLLLRHCGLHDGNLLFGLNVQCTVKAHQLRIHSVVLKEDCSLIFSVIFLGSMVFWASQIPYISSIQRFHGDSYKTLRWCFHSCNMYNK